jgi:HEAT repeat protein
MKFALTRMSDRDALVRQRAAEVLAKFAAVEHQRLVEGYRLQEKNDRVRLALDWSLYRMGMQDALYSVVRDLRSDSRRSQAVGYLSQLESPRLLYLFFDRADGKTILGLLQIMATIGDSDTIDIIKQFENSVEPGVRDAVTSTTREITLRLSQASPDAATRPRAVP